ncbi:MAG: DNA replication/repair protein RecF [Oscillospiraceae bacterium]|nr:DNA replication/repair protein RecF [Oscillospiraceae bacterium]
MRVDALQLEGFRNYEGLYAEFHPGINVIFGENAQGKTNLLEAVGYFSGAKSPRARSDRELISFDRETGSIKAKVWSQEREFLLESRLNRTGRRQMTKNGVKLKNAAELSGILNTVLFSPEDLYLIREGAAVRRRFLDTSISQLRPRYARALSEYHRLYEHKLRILKDWKEKPDLLETLEDFNLRLAQTGAILIHYRAHYIRKLREYAPDIHWRFSGGRERMELSYQTVKEIPDPEASPAELLPCLLAQQARLRAAELEAHACLAGAHKDDFLVTLNGISTKTYGSQGQTRTAALSLKLAEREISFHDSGEYPVLLLDDVLSELDPRRQEFVLNCIQGGQVFITCCEDERLQSLKEGKVFHIQAGKMI